MLLSEILTHSTSTFIYNFIQTNNHTTQKDSNFHHLGPKKNRIFSKTDPKTATLASPTVRLQC